MDEINRQRTTSYTQSSKVKTFCRLRLVAMAEPMLNDFISFVIAHHFCYLGGYYSVCVHASSTLIRNGVFVLLFRLANEAQSATEICIYCTSASTSTKCSIRNGVQWVHGKQQQQRQMQWTNVISSTNRGITYIVRVFIGCCTTSAMCSYYVLHSAMFLYFFVVPFLWCIARNAKETNVISSSWCSPNYKLLCNLFLPFSLFRFCFSRSITLIKLFVPNKLNIP